MATAPPARHERAHHVLTGQHDGASVRPQKLRPHHQVAGSCVLSAEGVRTCAGAGAVAVLRGALWPRCQTRAQRGEDLFFWASWSATWSGPSDGADGSFSFADISPIRFPIRLSIALQYDAAAVR